MVYKFFSVFYIYAPAAPLPAMRHELTCGAHLRMRLGELDNPLPVYGDRGSDHRPNHLIKGPQVQNECTVDPTVGSDLSVLGVCGKVGSTSCVVYRFD